MIKHTAGWAVAVAGLAVFAYAIFQVAAQSSPGSAGSAVAVSGQSSGLPVLELSKKLEAINDSTDLSSSSIQLKPGDILKYSISYQVKPAPSVPPPGPGACGLTLTITIAACLGGLP